MELKLGVNLEKGFPVLLTNKVVATVVRSDEKILKVRLFDINNYKARTLSLEEYVEGALAFAMSPKFHKEALKAQAICCRTFVVRLMSIFGGKGCKLQPGYDICSDDSHCQGYIGKKEQQKLWKDKYKEYNNKIAKAVDETKDIVIVYNGKPIKAVSHLACGGFTEDSENVWKNSVSYLRRVECSYCKGSPYWRTYKDFTVDELKRRLVIDIDAENKAYNKSIPGLIDDIELVPSGRVNKMRIYNRNFTGEDVKKLLKFPSTRFSWKTSGVSFEIKGHGHGLGLCKYGADGMAKLGVKADEILKFYFTGVELKRIEKPTLEKPLTGKTFVVDPRGGSPKDRTGPMGISEGYLNLEIARELQKILEEKGVKVYLTRNQNKPVTLLDRVRISNQCKPNFTITINQNVHSNENMSGTEIFYYPGDEEGKKLAKYIQKQLVSQLAFKNLGVKSADLYIIRETNNPSIQLNIAFLSNPKDERFLSKQKSRKKLAKAICTAILDYYRN